MAFHKYIRTPHIQGSRLQHGDYDLEAVSWDELRDKRLIVEEKMDGANAGISFENGQMLLQSRGHYLRGGPREKHFARFKQWAAARETELYAALGERFVMYGEWMFAKHTCFYDALPHFFMEFDLYDKESGVFLSTEARASVYRAAGVSSIIAPVLVLADGPVKTLGELKAHIKDSHFKTPTWKQSLVDSGARTGLSADSVLSHTDLSSQMEGLYIKWEDGGQVKGRYKFVRSTFTNSIMDQEEHWSDRPIVQNLLLPGAEEKMFG